MSSATLVQLPEEIKSKIRTQPMAIDQCFENRANVRVKALLEGELRLKSSPAVLRELQHRDPTRAIANTVVKDLSRSGIGLYFHTQLFPLEIFEVEFQNRLVTALVVRCRYLGPMCFEVGAKVIAVESTR